MSLYDLIRKRRDRIIAIWREEGARVAAGDSMPARELVDTLPVYLDELAASLEAEACGQPQPVSGQLAATHGVTRLQLGFAPHELIREYGLLRDAILAAANEDGYEPPREELVYLSRCLFTSISASVAAYVREHEAVLQRQASDHLAFLAHELRTPVTAARTGIEVLRRERPEDARLLHLANVVSRNLARLSQLLDNELTELRLRMPRTVHLEGIKGEQLVRELVEEAAPLADASGIRLATELETIELEADVRLLRSALSNLIVNAIKFSRRDGTVIVRLRRIEARARFEIEDECGGLPPGTVERIFDPFVQFGSDRSGFGLGLAIARQAVQAHDGNLAVHNLEGKGCIFLLEIPVGPSAA
ncbi:MAG: sensor histidine kinase [Deltaproteobacteria bacterium]|nr:MAG: sensor histidine kinase [Deltaproteobacteria bacterium]